MKIKYHILLFLSALSIGAQAGAIQEANEQLRSIFSHLHRPHPSVHIPEQENCHTISLQMPQGNIALIVIRYSDGSAYNQKILK